MVEKKEKRFTVRGVSAGSLIVFGIAVALVSGYRWAVAEYVEIGEQHLAAAYGIQALLGLLIAGVGSILDAVNNLGNRGGSDTQERDTNE